tara:strand:- start:2041 stop:3624 length:1584 start_codon:yes stop_codon:yes gene_type:complete
MNISKIIIENFYSFEKTELALTDKNGLVLIKGKNLDTEGSNGSGKSALLEAFYFGLTGKTIRKSNEQALVNNKNKKNCSVTIEVQKRDKKYTIFRGKKPTKLEFFCGEDNLTKDNVHNTQDEINHLLNINDKVLRASMFFGQSNESSFLDCSPEDKRTIIRNFLNLDDLFDKRDRIKSHKSGFYQTMKEQDAVISEHEATIVDLDRKLSGLETDKAKFSSYDESILNLELKDILNLEEKRDTKKWQLSRLDREIANVGREITKLDEDLRDPYTCPTCMQKTEPIKEVVLCLNQRDGLTQDLEKLNLNRDEILSEEISIPISSKEFCKILEYKDLCRDEKNYKELKSELSSKISVARKIKHSQKKSYDVMRFWEKAFSEQGLVKYIIRNILSYLNDNANYYLSYLTANKYFIEFDEALNEKIETNNKLVQYISLSGGEKRKINLAVLLSLKDLLMFTDKEQMNLLFFDEVAENLDEEGITGLHQLLQEIKSKKKVFVITHNKYLKTLLDSAPRISIIKSNGCSKITRK